MENKKIVRFLQSFILLPILTVSMPGAAEIPKPDLQDIVPTSYIVLSQKENIEPNGLLAYHRALDQKARMLEAQAEAIDAYFAKYNCPIKGMGAKFANEAANNGLDWRLLPAIAMIETTCGKQACSGTYKKTGEKKYTYNAFGWGSCKIGFDSYDDAVRIVAWNLGGNNPNTDHHYENKTTTEILDAFNPPSIVPKYKEKIMRVMKTIGPENLEIITVKI